MKARDLRKGDQFRDEETGFLIYTVVRSAEFIDKNNVLIQVRYTDGGIEDRKFPANREVKHVRP